MKVLDIYVHKNTIFYAISNGKEYSETKEYDTTMPKVRQIETKFAGENRNPKAKKRKKHGH